MISTGKEYSAANAPAPYDIDYGGPGSWASPRMPGRLAPPSPVVPYIDAGGRAIAGAVLLIIPEGVISKAGGIILIADSIDKLQALMRGDKTGFEKYLDGFGLPEKEKRAILCLKEISVITIEISAGFAGGAKNADDYAGVPKGVNPSKIRFSQDSIKASFKNPKYGTIDDLPEGLRSGKVKPGDIKLIRLVEREGKLISIDNRRLTRTIL